MGYANAMHFTVDLQFGRSLRGSGPFLITEVTRSHEIESGTGVCKNGKNVLRFCCLQFGLHSKPRFQSQSWGMVCSKQTFGN